MDPVRLVEGLVAPLDRADVDTDQIIPKQFLTRIERTGYGEFLFHDWRRDESAETDGGFVLDRPEYAGARILVAGRNFGCGSSREHAVWALAQAGFGAVIAPSFADIFRSNCFETGLVPVQLTEEEVRSVMDRALEGAGYRVRVDVEAREVSDDQNLAVPFPLGDFDRQALLEGLDRIGRTVTREDEIASYELAHPVPGAWRSESP